jgi:DNA-binding winged helix-turn-helix (wHTH) protein
VVYHFGPFTFDAAAFTLSRERTRVTLSPKALDLLAYLVARPGALATKDELFQTLWPGVFVTDNALTQTVSELRRGLGDDRAKPTYIQTVARRGYRFVAPVDATADVAPQATAPHRPRETSSLDAFRAFSEGRLRLESLDAAEVPAAVDDFRRAIELDPAFAAAYVGLANAHFWLYESARYRPDADTRLLALAIEEARCAVELDSQFAEAHATLAYLLVGAGELEAARGAASKAVALQPDHWPHYFRLGNASWGDERLRALRRCLELYPEFPFAYFQMAMVHVARGSLALAEQALRQGIGLDERHPDRRGRFPASGLHWMLGLIHQRRGETDSALAEFTKEVERGGRRLYAAEFALAARTAHGFVLVRIRKFEAAETMFRSVLEADDTQARARLGLSLALAAAGRPRDASRERQRARASIEVLRRAGRESDAVLLSAGELAADDEGGPALALLGRLLAEAPAGWVGWSIPVEPLFDPLRDRPGYREILTALAARAPSQDGAGWGRTRVRPPSDPPPTPLRPPSDPPTPLRPRPGLNRRTTGLASSPGIARRFPGPGRRRCSGPEPGRTGS